MVGDKIEEVIEKLEQSRTILYNDLNLFSSELSTLANIAIQNTISDIDSHIKDLEKQLEDLKWNDFIREHWENGR